MSERAGWVVLDRISGERVDRELAFNELSTLECLSVGLQTLAIQVKAREEQRLKDQRERGIRLGMSFGNVPGTDRQEVALMPCFFHWFGTSMCNYARLVGFVIRLSSGDISRSDLRDPKRMQVVKDVCRDYMQGIEDLAPVVMWRNKVAAHFAITDPRRGDAEALLDLSVMYPVTFSSDRYRVGELELYRDSSGECSKGALSAWSLTEVYESLYERFWKRDQICDGGIERK